jgi:hypothetical protein
MKIEGSGSISQRHGSADPDTNPDPNPDPHQNVQNVQNVMDPQHWLKVSALALNIFNILKSEGGVGPGQH